MTTPTMQFTQPVDLRDTISVETAQKVEREAEEAFHRKVGLRGNPYHTYRRLTGLNKICSNHWEQHWKKLSDQSAQIVRDGRAAFRSGVAKDRNPHDPKHKAEFHFSWASGWEAEAATAKRPLE